MRTRGEGVKRPETLRISLLQAPLERLINRKEVYSYNKLMVAKRESEFHQTKAALLCSLSCVHWGVGWLAAVVLICVCLTERADGENIVISNRSVGKKKGVRPRPQSPTSDWDWLLDSPDDLYCWSGTQWKTAALPVGPAGRHPTKSESISTG